MLSTSEFVRSFATKALRAAKKEKKKRAPSHQQFEVLVDSCTAAKKKKKGGAYSCQERLLIHVFLFRVGIRRCNLQSKSCFLSLLTNHSDEMKGKTFVRGLRPFGKKADLG